MKIATHILRGRTLCALVVITLLAATPACRTQPEPDAHISERSLDVAVVAPSAVDDLAFTQSLIESLEGLDAIDELEVSGEVQDAEAADTLLRRYAETGYDLVIAHGTQYGAVIGEVAADFPETTFAWGTGGDSLGLDNLYAYEAASDEGGYVLGTMAARLTVTGRIGVVGPVEVGDARRYVEGFANGVESVDPAVVVDVIYTGSFSDTDAAAVAAQRLIDGGADVLTGTSQMTIGAIEVVKRTDVAWFGTQTDQSSAAPESVVASQVYQWEVILGPIVEAVIAGDHADEVDAAITLENGGLEIVVNEVHPASGRVIEWATESVGSVGSPDADA